MRSEDLTSVRMGQGLDLLFVLVEVGKYLEELGDGGSRTTGAMARFRVTALGISQVSSLILIS